ncbi:hypothetical protein BC831DRAFT_426430 [Entophlyctis helioformis]|nr:hypothetical protein BC831DRAFT_426430 [Entophlyctis helioformis]
MSSNTSSNTSSSTSTKAGSHRANALRPWLAQSGASAVVGHEARRQRALEDQREKRQLRVEAARRLTMQLTQLADDEDAVHAPASTPASAPETVPTHEATHEATPMLAAGLVADDEQVHAMEGVRKSSARTRRTAFPKPQVFMEAEWLADIPEDFESAWLAVVVPRGERCLLISSRGRTVSRRADGTRIDMFLSCLPGGSYAAVSPRQSKPCILDCFYVPSTQTYHVLDILCWNGNHVDECDTEFRFFWLQTKLAEADVARVAQANQRSIVPLAVRTCSRPDLRDAVARAEQDAFAAGMLLYNKQCVYCTGESTPLCCRVVFPGRGDSRVAGHRIGAASGGHGNIGIDDESAAAAWAVLASWAAQ